MMPIFLWSVVVSQSITVRRSLCSRDSVRSGGRNDSDDERHQRVVEPAELRAARRETFRAGRA